MIIGFSGPSSAAAVAVQNEIEPGTKLGLRSDEGVRPCRRTRRFSLCVNLFVETLIELLVVTFCNSFVNHLPASQVGYPRNKFGLATELQAKKW